MAETEIHPILARCREQFMKRMEERRAAEHPYQVAMNLRHREMKQTWGFAGEIGGTPGYFIIYFCSDCLEGRIADFSYDQPGVQSYKELEVTIRSNWSLVCETRKEHDEQVPTL